jgi:Ca2+-binding RTX toxin-like protein
MSGSTTGNDLLSGSNGSDTIDLLAGDDTYAGLAGNDSVLGGVGNDSISGDDGTDTVLGGNGADSIFGGNDSDMIFPGSGNDSVDAGSGSLDSIRYNNVGALSEAIAATITAPTGSSGNNYAIVTSATQGNDTVAGFERLEATSNSGDLLQVNSAATANNLLFLYASGGNDTISVTGANNAVMADYNTAALVSGFTRGVSVDLSIGADTANPTGAATDAFGTDVLINVRGVAGSSLADTMSGTNFDDRFRSYAGNDYIDGRGGSDLADYASNASSQAISVNLAAGSANDGIAMTVDGATVFGTDTLISIEQVRATGGNDTLIGGNGNELLRGNGGSDSIDGGNGSDIADYSNNASSQAVSVNLLDGRANDSMGGTDTLISIENVWGGAGNDTIIGGNGAESLWGNSGNDSLVGGDGADTLDGGSGSDTIMGGDGNEQIFGGSGSDSIDAGSGTFDIVRFNHTGAEAITANINLVGPNRGGYNTATVATATQGTDTIINFEYINGSSNNDSFNISDAATFYASLYVFGSSGNDTITSAANPYGPYSNVFADYDAYSAANTAVGFTRGVSVDLQIGTDTLGRSVGSATDYAGTDMLVGVRGVAATSLNDTIYGTAFDDRFRPYAGNDIMDGREGFDMVDYSNNSSSQAVSVNLVTGRANDGRGGADTLVSMENVRGGSGNDTLLGDIFSEAFRGLAGDDSIDGGLGSDRIEYFDASATSGVSVNLITGTASDGRGGVDRFTSIENVYGGELNDYLVGIAQEGGTSRLRGDAGNDTLVGDGESYVVADYSSQTIGLSVNLASGSVNDGLGGIDSLVNIRGAQMFGNYADTLIGTSGDDWLSAGAGNDSIVGGDGIDILHYGGSPTMGISVNLVTGTAADGDGGTDVFIGIEAVVTGYSNDTVIGNNAMNYVGLSAGADYADGGGGVDLVSYRVGFSDGAVAYTYNESGNMRPFSGVTIDLAAGRATDHGNSVDTIINFEDADGSTMHDSILGSSGDNQLDGWEGNDTINAGAGNDTIRNDAGNDLLMGGAGNDLIQGGNGVDVDIDILSGGDGADTLDARGGPDATLYGGTGNDLYMVTAEAFVFDEGGSDTISMLGGGVETISAGAGDFDDTIPGIEAFDLAGSGRLLGLTAEAVIRLSDSDVLRVYGSASDSVVFEDTGWVRTGSSGGFETLANAAGNATVIASSGLASADINSVVTGGDGNDTIGTGLGADTIDGGNGSDIIAGFGGNDSILGGAGSDSIDGGDGADTILGGIGNDRLQGGAGNDNLNGGDGTDTLDGGVGSDTLIASAGNDSLAGGADSDLYVAGSTSLALQISDSAGNDTLSFAGAVGGSISSASLGSVSGIEAINLGGGGIALTLDAARVIALSTTTDELRVFGSGSDSLVLTGTGWVRGVPSGGFVTLTNGTAVVIASESLVPVGPTAGNDVLDGTAGNDTIDALGGDDSVRGLGGNDTLTGGAGNDTLDGGDGADSLVGGAGDDVFIVGDGDLVRELNVPGTDTVLLRRATFDMNFIFVENLRGDLAGQAFSVVGNSLANELTGGALADTLNGGTGNDTLAGGAGNDWLIGGSGNDQVSGSAGADAIDGGIGNDVLDGGGDADTLSGGAGDDSLTGGDGLDWASYADLAAANQAVTVNLATGRATGAAGADSLSGIENALGGAGNDSLLGDGLANQLIGGNGADTLTGGLGNDTLDGGVGADSLVGGDGDDVFIVGDGDLVRELNVPGTDTVLLRRATFDMNFIFVENLRGDLAGQAFSVVGNSLANELTGGALADTLNGGAGADTLIGGLGNDSLIGGTGNDQFIFNTALGATNVDAIQAYNATNDTILLDDAVFAALGSPGTLTAGAFNTGSAASQADDRIIYDSATGALLYDADGVGGVAAVQFATLTGVTGTINNTEFLII